MAFYDLLAKQMVPLTAALIGPQKELFLSFREVAWMFNYIETAHTQVTQVVAVAEKDNLVADLTLRIEKTDMRHDRMIRTVFFAMSASIEYLRGLLEARTAEADRLEQTRDRILPSGLAWVNVTFLEEAGNATTLKETITPELEAILHSVPLYGATVLEATHHWMEEGITLGNLERERVNLQASGKEVPDARAARAYWLTQIGEVITNLKKVVGRDAEVAQLLSPLLAAAKHVAKPAKKPVAPAAPDAEKNTESVTTKDVTKISKS